MSQHGGTISASNRKEGGARLEVALPAAKVKPMAHFSVGGSVRGLRYFFTGGGKFFINFAMPLERFFKFFS